MTSCNSPKALNASFRDPAAQVYVRNGEILRQIQDSGMEDYRHLLSSGLYEKLIAKNYLVKHHEVSFDEALNSEAKVVIKPEKIPFISYGYEWSFSQIKDAALLTLTIAKHALQHGMILKDASIYNIQFLNGKPIFIDTSSFAMYREGEPWEAYGQFCRHFLATLLLMAKVNIQLNGMLRQYIDGIPLDLASKLLPARTKFSFSIFAHIHAHARAQSRYSQNKNIRKNIKISKVGLLGLLDNLSTVIKKLSFPKIQTTWGNYYDETNYSSVAASHKAEIIERFSHRVNPKMIWDLGGNTGYYSRVVAKEGTNVLCFDMDPVAVEVNYLQQKKEGRKNLLPLLQDFTNPSASQGWSENERNGLIARGPADILMALALIHHLAISNNIPFQRIAEYLVKLGEHLIIEFVLKEDSQVQRLLASREDIFPHYHVEAFKHAFSLYYSIEEEIEVKESARILFLMKRKK